ncbi:MAG: hypothetical protein KF862_06115 [Chitinophagaceae bacterium]|nr:hypothetical protein [Chitinophagaceae bacterium]
MPVKFALTAGLVLAVCFSAICQTTPEDNNDKIKEKTAKGAADSLNWKKIEDILKKRKPADLNCANTLKRHLLIAENDQFRIYRLPLDNMPWVEPKVPLTMPNKVFNDSVTIRKIPNPFDSINQ